MTFYSVFFWCLVGGVLGAIISTAFWIYILKEGVKQGKFSVNDEKSNE